MKSILPVIPSLGISTISLTAGSSSVPILVTVQNQSYSPIFWEQIAAKLMELASTTIRAQAIPNEQL